MRARQTGNLNILVIDCALAICVEELEKLKDLEKTGKKGTQLAISGRDVLPHHQG